MKTKRVNRYYCDFCKKSGCSKWHLRRHEERCTLNPERTCGVCEMLGEKQPRLAVLIGMMPNPSGHKSYDDKYDYHYFDEAFTTTCNEALKDLRDAANDCPACILAAIRLSGIPVPVVSDFNWTNEMKNVFDEINNADTYE